MEKKRKEKTKEKKKKERKGKKGRKKRLRGELLNKCILYVFIGGRAYPHFLIQKNLILEFAIMQCYRNLDRKSHSLITQVNKTILEACLWNLLQKIANVSIHIL